MTRPFYSLAVIALLVVSLWPRNIAAQQSPPTPTNQASGSDAAVLPPYLDPSNWQRVQKGMSREEVLGILGKPSEAPNENRWIYMSARFDSGGSRVWLGTVGFDPTVKSVSSPDAEQLEKEKQFWITYGLRAEIADDAARIGAVPLWTDFSRWLHVHKGMSPDAVKSLLGVPYWGDKPDSDTWEYGGWSFDDGGSGLSFMGSIHFAAGADGTVVVNQFQPPRIEELHKMMSFLSWRQTAQGDWPQWTDPAAWLALRPEMGLKSIESLLGAPDKKERNTDVRATSETWHFGHDWSGGKIKKCGVTVQDPSGFPRIMGVGEPDWEIVATIMRDRTGDLAQAPRWSNAESWLRFQARLLAYRIHLDTTNDDLALVGKPATIEWDETPPPLSGLWRATWRFPNGGRIEWATCQPKSHPQPKTSRDFRDGYIIAVTSPQSIADNDSPTGDPTVDSKRGAAWKRLAAQFPTTTNLVPSSSTNWKVLAALIGEPDRAERSAAQVVMNYRPPNYAPILLESVPVCFAHYGDGVIAAIVDPSLDKWLPELRGSITVIQFRMPSDSSIAQATGNHPWPALGPRSHTADPLGHPHYLDLTRWEKLEPGDRLAWVIYVLGQPTSVEDQGDVKFLIYGPWKNDSEKWKAGRLELRQGNLLNIMSPQLVDE